VGFGSFFIADAVSLPGFSRSSSISVIRSLLVKFLVMLFFMGFVVFVLGVH